MLHKGARTTGGDMPKEINGTITALLDQFMKLVADRVHASGLPRAAVRSMLPCSTINVLDSDHLYVAGQKHAGMPSTIGIYRRDKRFTIDQVSQSARWEFGFDDPFVIQFPAEAIDQEAAEREPALTAIAASHVMSETERIERQMRIIQINPVFGPASFTVDPRLAFVLMPFTDELTRIYATIIKPIVEEESFGLVCRRADDIKSNKAIIQDIWKSICEARLVIADLSGGNPNVTYELGIAHTIGKETILIYQRGGERPIPFDLAHIRRIEYDNDALGGKKLEQELRGTIEELLKPTVKASP